MINRAINEQILVGNIGGYWGLFLGYSILQLPSMIQILSLKIKEKYRHFKSGNRLKKDNDAQIFVREESNNLRYREIEHCQSENTIAGMIELIEKMNVRIESKFSKIEETIENITKIVYDKQFLLK